MMAPCKTGYRDAGLEASNVAASIASKAVIFDCWREIRVS